VALYAALRDEVPTRVLFDALGQAGIARLMPRTAPDRRLEFALVESWAELVPGEFGVLAPAAGVPTAELQASDVVVLPGVAFDRSGWRLGRGGGYYDRSFPPDVDAGPALIGAACEEQLVDRVPHSSHDRAMDAIVTEHGVQWMEEGR
jgi:5-formyltetrahydrofolate cyclo-ligase